MTTTMTSVSASRSIVRPNALPTTDSRWPLSRPSSKLRPLGMPRSQTTYECRTGVSLRGRKCEAKKKKLADSATNMAKRPNASRRRTKAPIPYIMLLRAAVAKSSSMPEEWTAWILDSQVLA